MGHHIGNYYSVRSIKLVEVTRDYTLGQVRRTEAGLAVIARVRELHAEVQFYYKGEKVRDFGASLGIEDAVDSAKSLAKDFDINASSEAQMRVHAVVREISRMLEEPERHSVVPCYIEGYEAERMLNDVPGLATLELINEFAWSSAWPLKQNNAGVRRVEDMLMLGGVRPSDSLAAAQIAFEQRRRSLARRAAAA